MKANEATTINSKEIAVLREHFPACFSSEGKFDIDRFKEFLSDKVSITNEGYELRFLGKNYARLLASLDTNTVIVPDEEHNCKPENINSQNIYISGDNLDGLKHLLKSYSGKVKCIYIDPPYNTGSDGFVYKDNFAKEFTSEKLAAKLSISDNQAERILDLTSRNSASHSAWLMFMYPRLLLARDLLSDDGVIFISIDDNEQSNLKLLCDDVFGEQNFAGQIAVVNNLKGRNSRANIATTHEYLLMYVCERFVSGGTPLTEKQIAQYKYTDENGNAFALRDLRKRGGPDRREDRPNMWFPIYYNPVTKQCSLTAEKDFIKITPLKGDGSGGRWRWGKNHVANSLDILHPEQGKSGKWGIKHRVYLNPALNPVIDDDEFDEFDEDDEIDGVDIRTAKAKSFWQGGSLSTDVARRTLKDLLPDAEFDYPKSVDLIKRVLHMGTSPNCIVCDFFSGSATTMNAVMELNAEGNKNIKTILIQLPENLDEKKVSAKGEALTALKKNIAFLDSTKHPHTLDFLGIERLIHSSAKIRKKYPDTKADLGFKHFTLKEPSKQTIDKLENFEPEMGFILKNTILNDFEIPTILATWQVRDGYGFTAPLQAIDFAGYTGYYIDKHLYLINPNLTNNAITTIVERFETDGSFNPENVVLCGYSFLWTETEALKVNLARLKDSDKNLTVNFDIRY